ncbi:glycosyltransferase family 4 protein [Thalassospira tepidiphila]|uniref:glycosyltransferase family 4 protein n=1 Tax=Thalassospira tepidiphila TaxID=393657 RepID=UPI003AA99CB9
MKSVALLVPSFLPNIGGVEVGLHNIACSLSKLGWTPTVVAPWEHVSELKKANWKLPYRVIPYPPKFYGLATKFPRIGITVFSWYLALVQKMFQFDFWHVTMAWPTGCAIVQMAENSRRPIPYLIRCAGEDIQKQSEIGYGLRLIPKLDEIISKNLRKAKTLVAITDSVFEEYKKLQIPDGNIVRVPNGVPLARFRESNTNNPFRFKYEIPQDAKIVLSVGRNHPKKNYIALIRAMEKLPSSYSQPTYLVCIGNGVSDLKMICSSNLLPRTRFIETLSAEKDPLSESIQPELPTQDLINAYQASDVFAFPSLTETFGIAIIEAMAAELPVIVGDSDGCRDIVENGKWGLLCEPTNADQLAILIENLLNDPASMKKWSQKSILRAKQFDWEIIAQNYIKIYDESISKATA